MGRGLVRAEVDSRPGGSLSLTEEERDLTSAEEETGFTPADEGTGFALTGAGSIGLTFTGLRSGVKLTEAGLGPVFAEEGIGSNPEEVRNFVSIVLSLFNY